MEIRRLHEGDERLAVRVIEQLKFRVRGIGGVSVHPAYMRRILADDRHLFVVACVDDNPVGYAFGYRLCRFDGCSSVMFIYEVEVVERHRRQGIGRALIEEMKTLAKEDGCYQMFLHTNRSNEAAMALYQSAGGEEGDADATAFWWKW